MHAPQAHKRSAGSRDSSLTNHGFQQATRLANYLKSSNIKLSHIFSSQLQRAYKTAELVRDAQGSSPSNNGEASSLVVTRLPLLAEKDFGSYEGKAYGTRDRDSVKSRQHDENVNGQEFQDAETQSSMASRTDTFLDEHLLPLLSSASAGQQEPCVAIVSHALIMSVLWRRLLARLPMKSVTIAPELLAARTIITLERLGSWSNTGYMELDLQKSLTSSEVREAKSPRHEPQDNSSAVLPTPQPTNAGPSLPSKPLLVGYSITVTAINKTEHLKGFKRTRGGVGSSKHDEGQKTIESFFKRRKAS